MHLLNSGENTRSDRSKDRLCEDDDETACKAKESLRSLGRIVALETHTDLNKTPACEDDADRSDDAEDYVRHIVDGSFGFALSQNGNHANSHNGTSDGGYEIALQNCLASVFL